MLWRNLSEDTIQKMKDAATELRQTPWRKQFMGECQSWENHWNYQGWKTPLNKQIRKTFQYRQWRSDIYTRDDFTCVHCWQRWWRLEADHIKYFSTIMSENNITTVEEAIDCDELWNINNGQTLCYSCHRNKTKEDIEILKSNNSINE